MANSFQAHAPEDSLFMLCIPPPLATLPPWDVYLGERKGGFLEQPGRKRVGSANAKRAWKNSCRAIIRLRMRGSLNLSTPSGLRFFV